MIQAIIIDDEPKASNVLQDLVIEFCPNIQIVGIANSAESAYRLITIQQPDLIFLDIAMPKESGFDLLRRLPNLNFEIIFVTGFDEYAIDAIKFCAIGYIVKPIREEALIEAVGNAQRRIEVKNQQAYNQQLLQNLVNPGNKENRIGIPTSDGLEFMPTSQIIRCEGMKGCTKVIIENRKSIISSYNLGEFKKLLEPYGFYLPHKSHLINKMHIQRYDKEGIVRMIDGGNIPVARRKRQEFLEQMTRL